MGKTTKSVLLPDQRLKDFTSRILELSKVCISRLFPTCSVRAPYVLRTCSVRAPYVLRMCSARAPCLRVCVAYLATSTAIRFGGLEWETAQHTHRLGTIAPYYSQNYPWRPSLGISVFNGCGIRQETYLTSLSRLRIACQCHSDCYAFSKESTPHDYRPVGFVFLSFCSEPERLGATLSWEHKVSAGFGQVGKRSNQIHSLSVQLRLLPAQVKRSPQAIAAATWKEIATATCQLSSVHSAIPYIYIIQHCLPQDLPAH